MSATLGPPPLVRHTRYATLGQGFQKLEHYKQTDRRRTDRQTNSTEYITCTAAFADITRYLAGMCRRATKLVLNIDTDTNANRKTKKV